MQATNVTMLRKFRAICSFLEMLQCLPFIISTILHFPLARLAVPQREYLDRLYFELARLHAIRFLRFFGH